MSSGQYAHLIVKISLNMLGRQLLAGLESHDSLGDFHRDVSDRKDTIGNVIHTPCVCAMPFLLLTMIETAASCH